LYIIGENGQENERYKKHITKITYIQHLLESMKQKPMALFSSNVSDTTESFIF